MQDMITNQDIYLIIDDAHRMYDVGEFWDALKNVSSCRVICFATADVSRLGTDTTTPIVLNSKFRYETVRFSVQERDNLVAAFRESSHSAKTLLTVNVIADIDVLTDRHPGLLYACLRNILDSKSDTSKEVYSRFRNIFYLVSLIN